MRNSYKKLPDIYGQINCLPESKEIVIRFPRSSSVKSPTIETIICFPQVNNQKLNYNILLF